MSGNGRAPAGTFALTLGPSDDGSGDVSVRRYVQQRLLDVLPGPEAAASVAILAMRADIAPTRVRELCRAFCRAGKAGVTGGASGPRYYRVADLPVTVTAEEMELTHPSPSVPNEHHLGAAAACETCRRNKATAVHYELVAEDLKQHAEEAEREAELMNGVAGFLLELIDRGDVEPPAGKRGGE